MRNSKLVLSTLFILIVSNANSRIGTAAHPACVSPPSICVDLICNGGFEVHDAILNSPTGFIGVGAEFIPDANGESDIQGWLRAPNTTTSPDIWVRNGHGGIPATIINTVSPLPNTTGPVPNNTMAGIVTTEAGPGVTAWAEGIITNLVSPVIPGNTYTLSFDGYTVNTPALTAKDSLTL